jgi:site-specific recombinase XerD
MKSKEEDITVDILRKKLKGESDSKAKSLNECCQIYNSSFEKLVGIEIGAITYGRYATFAARISDFITTKMKQKDILLTDIKYSFGIEYEHYLKTELKLHQNTLVKYIQYLNRVLDYCVKYEWLDKNVLFGYKCPVKDSKREYLTQDELQRVMDKDINIERLREVRDIFVFCCHTGYAYKDAAELTPDHIGTGINGRKWIYSSRQKTDNVSNVPLLDQAMEIIEKYKDHPICQSKNRLLPMKSNQKLNAYLKELADICGISKPITTHIARHTFATTVLLSNGVSMEATSKMLGHSSLKTTQIYGKILETRVGAEMEMLSEKLSKIKKDDKGDTKISEAK